MVKLHAENGKLTVAKATPSPTTPRKNGKECDLYLVRGYKDGTIIIVPLYPDGGVKC